MEVKRGDVVIAVLTGDYGKPRPVVVAQSDVFNPTHSSIVVCPITSHLVESPLFRLTVSPGPGTGLRTESQIMIDKLVALRTDRIRKRIGTLRPSELRDLDRALRVWLALAPR